MAGYFLTKNNNKFNELEKNIYNDFPKYKSIRNIGKDKWNVLFFQKSFCAFQDMKNANHHLYI